jgi:lipid-A-disaccharide synthase
MISICFSATEISGQAHAGYLIGALRAEAARRNLPEPAFWGIGSSDMATAGARLFADCAGWGRIGFIDNLSVAGGMAAVQRRFAVKILAEKPDAVVLVDSRVFNLSLARQLRAGGYAGKIVHYVAPVVWESLYRPEVLAAPAYRRRFEALKRWVDLAIVIYPVSLALYEEMNIPHVYIGHPLADIAKATVTPEEFRKVYGLSDSAPVVVLMPGSRIPEIANIAPTMFASAKEVAAAMGAEFVVPVAHPVLEPKTKRIAEAAGVKVAFVQPGAIYNAMAAASLIIAKSGTATHQALMMTASLVAVYQIPAYQRAIYRRVVRFEMPFYAFPNLIAGREVVPELVAEKYTQANLSAHALKLLTDPSAAAKLRADLAAVRAQVTRPDPLAAAATAVWDLIGS